MKSQINLLHREFKPHFEWICGSHLFGFVIFVCLLSGFSYVGLYYWYSLKSDDAAKVRVHISAEQQTIEELTNALTSRKSDPLLEKKLAYYIDLAKSRSTLLSQIGNLSALKQRSFSALFNSFSQAHSSELWLTNFLVTPTELNIEGQIAKPKALPIWISQLSQTSFFAGQKFDDASVSRNQNILIFSLNSSIKENDADVTASTLIPRGLQTEALQGGAFQANIMEAKNERN